MLDISQQLFLSSAKVTNSPQTEIISVGQFIYSLKVATPLALMKLSHDLAFNIFTQ